MQTQNFKRYKTTMKLSNIALIVFSIILLVIYLAVNNEKTSKPITSTTKKYKYATGSSKVMIEHLVTDVEFEEIEG